MSMKPTYLEISPQTLNFVRSHPDDLHNLIYAASDARIIESYDGFATKTDEDKAIEVWIDLLQTYTDFDTQQLDWQPLGYDAFPGYSLFYLSPKDVGRIAAACSQVVLPTLTLEEVQAKYPEAEFHWDSIVSLSQFYHTAAQRTSVIIYCLT